MDYEVTGVGVDIRSAYPSVLQSVGKVPMFSAMDDFRTWQPEDGINDNCFYIVENVAGDESLETWLLLNRRVNLVSGWSLNNANVPRGNYKVLAVVKPVHLADNPFPGVVSLVAEQLGDPLTDIAKFTLNSAIGLLGRRKTQKMEGAFTTDLNEARSRVASDNDIYFFADGRIYIVKSPVVLLEDGFFPLQFVVYDRMRVSLLKLFRLLRDAGAVVYGVHTDCFIVDHVPEGFPLVETGEGRLVANFGKYRRDPSPVVANVEPFHVGNNEEGLPRLVRFDNCREPVDVEVLLRTCDMDADTIPRFEPFNYWRVEETMEFNGNKVAVVPDGSVVLGACAGSGKTTACLANAKGCLHAGRGAHQHARGRV